MLLRRSVRGWCAVRPQRILSSNWSIPTSGKRRAKNSCWPRYAVAPLLVVWADPQRSEAHPHLVDVLLSLLSRVDDERLPASLGNYLKNGPHAEVRARIARGLGLQGRDEVAGAIVEALQDGDENVRYESLLALNRLEGRLSEDLRQRTQTKARQFVTASHAETRTEATPMRESTPEPSPPTAICPMAVRPAISPIFVSGMVTLRWPLTLARRSGRWSIG